MNITARLRASLLVLSLVSAASLAAQSAPSQAANRIAAGSDMEPMTRLTGHLPLWVNSQTDAGAVPDATPIHLSILLARSPERELAFTQRIIDQQNPASAHFHQWLTPAQIGEEFGPSVDDVAAVTSWLTARGMRVTSVSPSRIFVEISSTTGVVAAALGTSFHTFTLDGEARLSATSEPAIPTALSVGIAGISGLTDVPLRPFHTAKQAAPRATGDGLHPMYSNSTNTTHYLFPGDFAKIYDINAITGAGFTGSGIKVAIIGRSRITDTDITELEALAGIPAKVENTIVVPGATDPGLVANDEDESTLDVGRVLTVATGAQADLVIASTATGGISTAIQYNVQTLMDPVMTISYGACEKNAGATNVSAFDALFKQGAAEGISTFVSSGDSGAAGCSSSFTKPTGAETLGINYLCSSSYVTCVGGTEFNDTSAPATYWAATNSSTYTSALGYIPEGAWNEPAITSTSGGVTTTTYEIGGTGGGTSLFITKPTWQTGTTPADSARDVPDISFASASHDGYYACLAYKGAGYDCNAGGGVIFSGTSAAAPDMAAVAAILDQKAGKAQGNLNPVLYTLAASTPTAFHDATPASSGVSGCPVTTASICNNSLPGPTSLSGGLVGFPLLVGFDLATGLGSLDVTNFVNAAVTAAPAGTTTTLTATPTTIAKGGTAVFTATVTNSGSGTPTGNVQFYSNGTPLGAPVILAGGKASTAATAFPIAGTYSITAIYSGDTNNAASTSKTLSFVVTQPVTTTTLTAAPTTVVTGGSAVFSAAIAATSGIAVTGTVQFFQNGTALGSAVAVAAGNASTASTLFTTAGTYAITATYSGDSNNAGSTSAALSFVVTPATVSGLTATASPTTLAVAAGATTGNTSTITLATTASYYGSVAMNCAVGNSTSTTYPPTCTFAPASVSFAGTTTGSSVLTIGTTVPHSQPGGMQSRNIFSVPAGGLSLAGLLLLIVPARRRRKISWLAILPLVLLGAGFMAITGCGSGGSSVPTPTPVGTTKGSYVITVTATPSAGTAATTTVTLTVQ